MTDYSPKRLYQIALTMIPGIGVAHARTLMQAVGDEEAVFSEKGRVLEKIPRISRRLISAIHNPDVLHNAGRELRFAEDNNLQLLFFTDDDYPSRLNNCFDAPILLYSKGNADFNSKKIISIVGTRNATPYGQKFCEQFIGSLAKKYPETVVVSGLAYGIDIYAHRHALQNNLSTVAILAHGLDRIYPETHRRTAIEMLEKGALVTEFPSNTQPDRFNFVTRNRIVAGMSDATIVVESGERGGSLITAEIANSYFREVFAVPGKTTDNVSKGCNHLIANNKAVLLLDAKGFIEQMNWDSSSQPARFKQRELFPDFSEEEEHIFNALSKTPEGLHVNMLGIELNMPVSNLFFTLLELEIKNVIQALPGGMYKLL